MALLKLKSKGEAVKTLQKQLIKLGYKLTADGDFGQLTESAVKDFQLSNGLSADGIVGAITQSMIDSQLSSPNVLGIDVSRWNGLIDWNKVASTEYKFFILKCSEDENFRDSHFAANYAEVKRLGLIKGAYHFFRFFSDAKKQAQNFLASGFDFNDALSLPPVIDIEWQDKNASTNVLIKQDLPTYIGKIKIWLKEVETQTGRKPMIYTQKSFWNDVLGAPSGFEAYPLWVAYYNINNPAPVIPTGFPDWKLWQYSSGANVNGIIGNVDVNRFNGSMTALKKMLK